MALARIIAATALVAAFAGPVGAHTESAGALEVIHPWVEPAPAGAAPEARPTIRNTGDEPLRMVGARSPAAESVRLLKGGEPAEAVSVAAGEVLPPGRVQLELVGLNEPLKKGATVPVTLELADRPDARIELVVGRDATASD